MGRGIPGTAVGAPPPTKYLRHPEPRRGLARLDRLAAAQHCAGPGGDRLRRPVAALVAHRPSDLPVPLLHDPALPRAGRGLLPGRVVARPFGANVAAGPCQRRRRDRGAGAAVALARPTLCRVRRAADETRLAGLRLRKRGVRAPRAGRGFAARAGRRRTRLRLAGRGAGARHGRGRAPAAPLPPLACAAWLALGARDPRRFTVGVVGAMGLWFVLFYPDIGALPVPTGLARLFQTLPLPT